MSSIDSSHSLIPESGGDRQPTSRTSRPTDLIDTGQNPSNDPSETVRQSLPSSRNLPVTTRSQGSVVQGTENKLVQHAKKMGAALVKGVINISKWISQNKVLTAGVLGGVGILLLASGYGAPIGICLLIAAVTLPTLAHVIAKHAEEGNNEQMQDTTTRATQGHAEALDQHSRTPRQITSQSNPSPRLGQPASSPIPDDRGGSSSAPSSSPSTPPPGGLLPFQHHRPAPPPPSGGSGMQPPPPSSRDRSSDQSLSTEGNPSDTDTGSAIRPPSQNIAAAPAKSTNSPRQSTSSELDEEEGLY